jgi:hypothetical protein
MLKHGDRVRIGTAAGALEGWVIGHPDADGAVHLLTEDGTLVAVPPSLMIVVIEPAHEPGAGCPELPEARPRRPQSPPPHQTNVPRRTDRRGRWFRPWYLR